MRVILESWRVEYNERRPPSALGYRTPNEYAGTQMNRFDGGYAPPNPAPLAAAGVRGELRINATKWLSPSREPRRRSSVAARAYRDQGEALSHTGSFGRKLSSGGLVWSDETFRILEDDRSVNRHAISFERIHPEDLSSAPQVSETTGTKLPSIDIRHVLCK